MANSAIVVPTLTGKLFLSTRSATAFSRARPDPSGFTLFELVVTLAVMSVALALVGPALVPRKAEAKEVIANLISDSRRTATHRAEAMQLDVDAEGIWTLSKGTAGEPSLVKRGRLASSPGAFRILISPLGICGLNSSVPIRIDPLTCSVVPPESTK